MFLIHVIAIVDQWVFVMPTPDGRPDIHHADVVAMGGRRSFPTRREAVEAAESRGLAVRGHHVVRAGWFTPDDAMRAGTPGTPRPSGRDYHRPALDAEPLAPATEETEIGAILAAVDRELTAKAGWTSRDEAEPRWRVGSYGYVDADTWDATFADQPAWTRDAYMCVRNGIDPAAVAATLRKAPHGFHQWARRMFYSGWDGAVWAEPDARIHHA